jgi:hypothetical protein
MTKLKHSLPCKGYNIVAHRIAVGFKTKITVPCMGTTRLRFPYRELIYDIK